MKHRQITTSYSRILHIEDNICFVTIGNCTYFPNFLLIPANLLFTTIVACLIGHQQVVTSQIWNIRTTGGTLPQNQIKFCVFRMFEGYFCKSVLSMLGIALDKDPSIFHFFTSHYLWGAMFCEPVRRCSYISHSFRQIQSL
jgi:hypothetical protein